MRHGTHSSEPPFLKGGVNFKYLPWRGGGGIWKNKKWGGNMVLGQVFLKGGLALSLFTFFEGLSSLHLEINFPFAKLCYAFEEKLFFSVTIILWKIGHSKLSKNEPENIP